MNNLTLINLAFDQPYNWAYAPAEFWIVVLQPNTSIMHPTAVAKLSNGSFVLSGDLLRPSSPFELKVFGTWVKPKAPMSTREVLSRMRSEGHKPASIVDAVSLPKADTDRGGEGIPQFRYIIGDGPMHALCTTNSLGYRNHTLIPMEPLADDYVWEGKISFITVRSGCNFRNPYKIGGKTLHLSTWSVSLFSKGAIPDTLIADMESSGLLLGFEYAPEYPPTDQGHARTIRI
jgi:hypothetical protein